MLEPGDIVGEWIVESPIADGAFGSVWRARNKLAEGVQCALKVVIPNAFDAPRERFQREIEALAQLRHEAIVQVLGWGETTLRDELLMYIALEMVHGQTMQERLRDGRIPTREVRELLRQVASGLAYAHRAGFAHRDVKPTNLMITPAGKAKILDFGIALAEDRSRLTAAGGIVGTTIYMPPEVFVSEVTDAKLGDIYSLGVVLFEVTTRKRAFRFSTLRGRERRNAVMKAKASPIEVGEDCPADVRSLIAHATQPNPNKRIQTMVEFEALLAGLDESVVQDEHGEWNDPADAPTDIATGGPRAEFEVEARPKLPPIKRTPKWPLLLVMLLAGSLAIATGAAAWAFLFGF